MTAPSHAGGDAPHGRLSVLLAHHARPGGLVLDLGCRSADAAALVAGLGLTYVGCGSGAASAPGSPGALGFESHDLDLDELDALEERLAKIVDDRPVSAILLVDVLERLADPDAFLHVLTACTIGFDRPLLGVSVGNVAHFDVGAKLLAGRWDVTGSGLLDRTRVQHFTDRRLRDLLEGCGWLEVARQDLRRHHSDQHFPADHPVLVDGGPLRDLLWAVRARLDDFQTVDRFVRLYAPVSVASPLRPPEEGVCPFLSVLVRTVGSRMPQLEEALTCLAAQSDDDIEVILLVHSPREEVLEEVRALVGSFAPPFRSRVIVVQVPDGGRSRPLNVGLDSARGRYLAFLDDDDVVTADWAEAFHASARVAPGRVARSIAADRWVRRSKAGSLAPYRTLSRLELAHAREFDLVEHLFRNRTPICSFAVPLQPVRQLRVRFDEQVPVMEDWQFLLEVAVPCGVHDTGEVTSIYHRWQDDESCLARVDPEVWDAAKASVLSRLDARPLLLPAGSASRLGEMFERALVTDGNGRSLLEQRDVLESQVEELKVELQAVQRSVEREAEAAAEARASLDEILSSSTWRATYPVRWAMTKAREAAARRLGRRSGPPRHPAG